MRNGIDARGGAGLRETVRESMLLIANDEQTVTAWHVRNRV